MGLSNHTHKNVILNIDQTRTVDRKTIASSKTGFELLSAAGRQVFEVVRKVASKDDRILVACGSGNNGGDGLIAARLLLDDGFNVSVALMGAPESLLGDVLLALNALNHPTIPLSQTRPADFELIIDALLGTGIDRLITGKLAKWIDEANASIASVISIDIPTGISGDSGAVMGTSIEAEHTVTFFRKKPGHVLFPGRHYCGTIHLRQIGINASLLEAMQPVVYENDCSLWQELIPSIDWHDHKYTRGHTLVITGGASSTGAARLAGRAALRAGAGVVTFACPESAIDNVAAHVTCEMIKRVDSANELEDMLTDNRIKSIVLGPGMGVGSQTRAMVRAALNSSASVVLDADALTSFTNRLDELVKYIAAAKGDVVLTPHRGEFSRLFDEHFLPDVSLTSEIHKTESELATKSKIQLTIEAAKVCGATVVLKGPDTVIANPDGNCIVNTNAPPWLATAGSGDVLAGTIAGWLAQSVNGFISASIGCWMHGEAARAFGPGLIATDIPKQYPLIHRHILKLHSRD